MSTAYHPITPAEFHALKRLGGRFAVDPKHKHLYDAMRRLKGQSLPGIKVELNGLKPGVAQKKVHGYAAKHQMDIETKVRSGWIFVLRSER